MKLYHYITKGSHVFKTGLFSFAKSPNVNLNYYIKRSGYQTQAEIAKWMDTFFSGYSRGIRVLREPLKSHSKALHLKEIITSCDLLEIDAELLKQEGLLEAVYYHPPLSMNEEEQKKQLQEREKLHNDGFYPIQLSDISQEAVDYSVCDDESGRRFAFLPFYLLVMKKGIIPPKYIRQVK
ncbi:MAG: hypothetical protein ACI4OR_03695 [Alphaproteobacteria bacterium]